MRIFFYFLFIFLLFFSCLMPEQQSKEEEQKSYKGTLIITEIGSSYYANDSRWIEIYNNSKYTAKLSDWTLRCMSVLKDYPYTIYEEEIFTLPDLLIEPGCYALIRGKASEDLVNSNNILFIIKGDRLPFWSENGFIELKGKVGIDFVRFGSNNTNPTKTGEWQGVNAPSLPYDMNQ